MLAHPFFTPLNLSASCALPPLNWHSRFMRLNSKKERAYF